MVHAQRFNYRKQHDHAQYGKRPLVARLGRRGGCSRHKGLRGMQHQRTNGHTQPGSNLGDCGRKSVGTCHAGLGNVNKLPANTTIVISPASKALQPNPRMNISGSKNGTALITNRYSAPPLLATWNVWIRSARRSSSGCRVRLNHHNAAVIARIANPSRGATPNHGVGAVPTSSMPMTKTAKAPPQSMNPTQSGGAPFWCEYPEPLWRL